MAMPQQICIPDIKSKATVRLLFMMPAKNAMLSSPLRVMSLSYTGDVRFGNHERLQPWDVDSASRLSRWCVSTVLPPILIVPETMLRLIIILCLLGYVFALAENANDWKSRSIYQVFTDRFARTDGSTTAPCNPKDAITCSGTWRGIINHLDYIQGMGFDAVMISPVTKNLNSNFKDGDAHHGFGPQNIYELNEKFGTHKDLLDLSKALHDRGMYLMVDIVTNKTASKADTEDDASTPMMKTWIENLTANYSIDGLRIDAAKHVDMGYLKKIVNASSLFVTGDVAESKTETICEYQNSIPSVPNYPLYLAIIEAFGKGNMSALVNAVYHTKADCKDASALGTFSESYGLPRFPSYSKDLSLAKNVIAFTMLSDGIPMYYQGQEQHLSGGEVPANHEALWLSGYNTTAPLYEFTATVNKIRQQAIRVDDDYLEFHLKAFYNDSQTAIFRKGFESRHMLTVYSNQGEDAPYRELRIPRCGPQHSVFTEVTTCSNYTVDAWGALYVRMEKGLPQIFFPADQMGGSGLCGVGDWPIRGSKAKGDGMKDQDRAEQDQVKENPKWGRKPGRVWSKPIQKAKEKKKKKPEANSGGRSAQGGMSVCFFALAWAVFSFLL
ncbi:alpha-amylase [Emydomyces testavorans]|uniref:alpha-amylase n=1 Tax=Emydomyces testavorans TaxID=2070801 RepID=A0AAF0ILK8_9EURO|nr:alpha-amylase [Emydomyces testavorans]